MATVKEDKWLKSCCNMCFCGCGILVHVVDGVVVEIKGDPDSPVGSGRLCPKGNSGIMELYDPNRITKPMKRTNPQKGRDIDPGWQVITWDEAYDLAAAKLGEALSHEGGGKNVGVYGIVGNMAGVCVNSLGFAAVQAPATIMPDICGAGIHTLYDLFLGSGNAHPDYKYCKYVVQFGVQAGSSTRHGFNQTTKLFNDARVDRGMHLISVDPHMGAGGEKADEWVPIRPGTDAAFAMAIAHTFVHELGTYDREFLKKYTNATYLVNVETKRVMRAEDDNHALVWDATDECAKKYDDPTLTESPLEGEFKINGVRCRTAFSMYKDHIKKYTPEYAEKVTTIPASTIRRISKEAADAASIGMTIELDGKTFPFRPVAFDAFSGVSRHKHEFLACWSVFHLNLLLGSMGMPGGYIAFGTVMDGFTEKSTFKYCPTLWEEDGLVNSVGVNIALPGSTYDKIRNNIHLSDSPDMFGIMPFVSFDSMFDYVTQTQPEKYHVHPFELLWMYAGNPLKNWGNQDEAAEWLKSFKDVIQVDLFLNDSSYFADLFLPEAQYLERYDAFPNGHSNHHTIGGLDVDWGVSMRQPCVPPKDDCPTEFVILQNVFGRLNMLPYLNGVYNAVHGMQGYGPAGHDADLPYDRMATDQDYCNLVTKNLLGPEYDVAWFEKNGPWHRPRTVDEVYYFDRLHMRVPLYFDMMLEAKEKVDAIVEENDIPWDTSDYQALPDYKPCHDFEIHHPGYDLFVTYYTNATNTDSWQAENAWINECNEQDPYGYTIEINAQTAAERGLKSGDWVTLTAHNGYQEEGRIICTQGVHPEVVSVLGGLLNSKSKFLPNAKDKGIAASNLMTGNTFERMDHISGGYDQCVRVKIEKKAR